MRRHGFDRLSVLAAALWAAGVTASAAQARGVAWDDTLLASRLAVGDRVEVKGRLLPDGSLLADEIELKRETDDDEELRGLVESVDSATGGLKVLGFAVRTSRETVFIREPDLPARFEDLSPGMRVKVDGHRDPEGRFLAQKVRIRLKQYAERKIVGAIEAIEADSREFGVLSVLGMRVILGEGTELIEEGAAARPTVGRRMGVTDEDDLLFTGRGHLGGRLALAGEIRLKGAVLSNPDLDPSTGDATTIPAVLAAVGLAADLGPAFAYVEVLGERRYVARDDQGLASEEERGDVRIGEAYVEARRLPVPRLSVAVGRQKFDEDREWYYSNKNLDAVRLSADLSPVILEASISRDLFDESTHLRDQDLVNLMARARYAPRKHLAFEAFYLGRRDRTPLADSPQLLGFRAIGEAGRWIEFWADLAREWGTRGRVDPASGEPIVRDVLAHAIDVGITYRPRIVWDPSFTAGFAMGSGDDEAGLEPGRRPSGADGTFHQSGLHRNRDSWNGVVSFKYYGEALDPELSNLRILTLGAGVRPIRSFSADLIYHRFRQDVPTRHLQGSQIDADPSGLDPVLGREVDLVIGYEPRRELELRLTAGLFLPGAAFEGEARPANVVTFQSKFRF